MSIVIFNKTRVMPGSHQQQKVWRRQKRGRIQLYIQQLTYSNSTNQLYKYQLYKCKLSWYQLTSNNSKVPTLQKLYKRLIPLKIWPDQNSDIEFGFLTIKNHDFDTKTMSRAFIFAEIRPRQVFHQKVIDLVTFWWKTCFGRISANIKALDMVLVSKCRFLIVRNPNLRSEFLSDNGIAWY